MKFLKLFFVFLLSVNTISAQYFVEATESDIIRQDVFSANNMAMVDLNKDGLSDLVESNHRSIVISWGARHGDYSYTQTLEYDDLYSWSMTIGDIDNNGVLDILQARVVDEKVAVYFGERGDDFIPEYKLGYEIELSDNPQSMNLIDINKDGALDLFVCNDNGINFFYENDGQGNFNSSPNQFDFNTVPASNNAGSYGSVFSDVNKDGQPELYISRCYATSTSIDDPQRINQLFFLEDTIYRNRAVELGVASQEQSWCAEIFDANLDGKWDILLANHTGRTALYINQDTVFENEAPFRRVNIEQAAMQILTFDSDNDGDEDILMTGNGVTLLVNDGAGFFNLANLPKSFDGIHTATIGDINQDGFLDVIGSFATGYNVPSNSRKNKVWLGATNENNYMKFQLEGYPSNLAGIGSRLEIYTNGKRQMREVRSSTSFGICKDIDVHFGIGQHEQVDSLLIYWPSGNIDVHKNLEKNHRYIAVEQEHILKMNHEVQTAKDDLILCPGGTTLDAGIGDKYLWSTGDTTRLLTVNEVGLYTVRKTVNNRILYGMPFLVKEEAYNINLISSGVDSICFGSSYPLIAEVVPNRDILWSTNDTSYDVLANQGGVYYFDVLGKCATYRSDTIELFSTELSGENTIDTVKKGEDFTFSAGSNRAVWYGDEFLVNVLSIGSEYETYNNQSDLQLFYTINDTITHPSESHGKLDRGYAYGFNPDDVNDFTYVIPKFDVTLDGFTVYTDTVRELNFEIKDELALDYFEYTTMLDSGKNIIKIEVPLSAHKRYKFQTNKIKNLENFGTASPHLYRSDGVNFPLEGSLLTIEGRLPTLTYYYYFYDIKARIPTDYCESEVYSAMLYVDSNSATNGVALFEDIQVSPNPATSTLYISAEDAISRIEWYDVNGKWLSQKYINTFQTIEDLSSFDPGVFLLKIWKKDRFTVRKIVVLK